MSEDKPNRCPYCTKKMDVKEEWANGLFKTAILECPEHGEIRINVED